MNRIHRKKAWECIPRVTMVNDHRQLSVTVRRNRDATVWQVIRHFYAVTGMQVSHITISRRLYVREQFARFSVCVPLTSGNRTVRFVKPQR